MVKVLAPVTCFVDDCGGGSGSGGIVVEYELGLQFSWLRDGDGPRVGHGRHRGGGHHQRGHGQHGGTGGSPHARTISVQYRYNRRATLATRPRQTEGADEPSARLRG